MAVSMGLISYTLFAVRSPCLSWIDVVFACNMLYCCCSRGSEGSNLAAGLRRLSVACYNSITVSCHRTGLYRVCYRAPVFRSKGGARDTSFVGSSDGEAPL
ncbi:unnamed protein product [Ectocarpus sp. 12 AP-2014]